MDCFVLSRFRSSLSPPSSFKRSRGILLNAYLNWLLIMSTVLLILSLLLLVTTFLVFNRSRKRDSPPGPAPIPLLGNIPDLLAIAGANIYEDGIESPSSVSSPSSAITPKAKSTPTPMHVLASNWAKLYGHVIQIHILTQPLIFLSSPQAVSDLLEKRGAIYSDKPHMVMAGELCGCQNMVAFTPYSAQSKRQRRLLNRAFSRTSIPAYEPLITRCTNQFLSEILSGGVDYTRLRTLARRYAGGLTLAVVYGYEPVPLGLEDGGKDPDPFIRLASECVDILQKEIASGGGIWAVDVLPWLRYLPLENIPFVSFLPGLSFQRKARVWKTKMEEFVEAPWAFLNSAVVRIVHSNHNFDSKWFHRNQAAILRVSVLPFLKKGIRKTLGRRTHLSMTSNGPRTACILQAEIP